jgi:hypothetical protein
VIGEADRAWAKLVVATGLAYTPTEYRQFSRGQRNALVAEANRAIRAAARRR